MTRRVAGAARSRGTAAARASDVPPLKRYGGLAGGSGVRAYATLPGAIAVEFVDGAVYLYTDASAGAACIARMHRLAAQGRGLSTLISRVVRNRFERRLR